MALCLNKNFPVNLQRKTKFFPVNTKHFAFSMGTKTSEVHFLRKHTPLLFLTWKLLSSNVYRGRVCSRWNSLYSPMNTSVYLDKRYFILYRSHPVGGSSRSYKWYSFLSEFYSEKNRKPLNWYVHVFAYVLYLDQFNQIATVTVQLHDDALYLFSDCLGIILAQHCNI